MPGSGAGWATHGIDHRKGEDERVVPFAPGVRG
jgi:hypothetical protein